jgi:hypothetical protein
MLGFSRRDPNHAPPNRPQCSRCGAETTLHYIGPGHYFCESCLGRLRGAPEVPFDVILDAWTAQLGELQAAGELIAVCLSRGFYGVCLLTGESALELACRAIRRERSSLRTLPSARGGAGATPPGLSARRSGRPV